MLNHFLRFTVVLMALLVSDAINAAVDFDQQLDTLEVALQVDLTESERQIETLEKQQNQLSQLQLARFHTLSSIKHLYLGEFEQALFTLDKALLFKPDNELMTQISMYKITANIGQNNYQQAFQLLEESLARIDSYDDSKIKVNAYIRLMNVYMELDAFEEMLTTATEILSLNKGENKKNECYAKLYLPVANLKLENFELSASQFKEAELYCNKHNFPLIVAMAIKGQSHVLFETGQYQASLSGYLDSLERYQAFKFHIEIHDSHAYLSEVYFHLGDYDQALTYAKLVEQLPNEPMNLKGKKRTFHVQSMIASKQGKFKEAYQYQVQAHAIGVQLLDEKKVKENAYQMVKFDSAEKTRELNKLVQDHEMIAKQRSILNNEKSASFMFSTVLAGTVALLALLLYTAWNQRNQFRKQAQVDSLTGLFNRGAGIDKAENEFIKTLASGGTFSVVVIDLDWFKKINDSFGHATGDWALKKVADTINEYKRSTDIACRLGGEEFAIFMPNTDKMLANEVAENVCQAFANINTRYSGHQFTITASIGVSDKAEEDLSLDPIINRADTALYQAKSNGRNRVVCL